MDHWSAWFNQEMLELYVQPSIYQIIGEIESYPMFYQALNALRQ